jgi:hypothetical protein
LTRAGRDIASFPGLLFSGLFSWERQKPRSTSRKKPRGFRRFRRSRRGLRFAEPDRSGIIAMNS